LPLLPAVVFGNYCLGYTIIGAIYARQPFINKKAVTRWVSFNDVAREAFDKQIISANGDCGRKVLNHRIIT